MKLCICELCRKDVMLTDEYIRLTDCCHIFHRICMIHKLARLTDKKFFLTEDEILKNT